MNTTTKKKILYIITKSEPFGGAQKYIYDLATNLPNEYQVLVAFGGEGLLKEKLESVKVQTISIPRLARDISLFDETIVFFDLIKILKEHTPDIVHLNSSKIGGLGALAVRTHNLAVSLCNFFGKRFSTHYSLLTPSSIIFTAHGWPFKEERALWQTTLIKLLSWVTVVLSHQTIVVSEDDQEHARWMPFVQKKLHTIHNGSQPIKMVTKTTARKFFKESGVSFTRGDTILGMIGELTPNKGYRDVIRGMEILIEQHPHTRLLIMGGGEEQEELNELIVMKELTEHVFLLGPVPDAAKYLHSIDMFILTSHKEGLPYVLVEAGHAALPSVATAVGGVPELIDDMRSGILVRPHVPQEIANAIAFLLDNPEHQRSFGDALHEKVLGAFSFKKMLERTIRLY